VLDLTNERALLRLSDGGKDAVAIREFHLTTKQFVVDGFHLPESKTTVTWINGDTLLIGTAADSLGATDSGYSKVTRRWHRGTPFENATEIYVGKKQDVGIYPAVSDSGSGRHEWVIRSLTFYDREYLLIGTHHELTPIPVPLDAKIEFFQDQLLVEVKSDWDVGDTTLPSGALAAINFDAFMAGTRDFTLLFDPQPRVSLARGGYTTTLNYVVISTLDNVNGRLTACRYGSGAWSPVVIETPAIGSASVRSIDSGHSDEIFISIFSAASRTGRSLLITSRTMRSLG